MATTAPALLEDLVFIDAEDSVLLAGVVTRPATEGPSHAIVYVHGYPISGHLPFSNDMARALAARGYAFVAGNTRGHDIGTWLFRRDGKTQLGGAWYELIEEAPYDLGAWIRHAATIAPRVILFGYSFGGVKAVLYQAERNDPRVAGLIVGSSGGRRRPPDPERLALAEKWVSEGRGVDLLPWENYGDPSGTMSAQTFVSRARADLDVFGYAQPHPPISRIACPILLCYGSEEMDDEDRADLPRTVANARTAASVRVEVIEGARHGFVGYAEPFAQIASDWIASLA